MPHIKSMPNYYLTNITCHTPRNKYQIEVLDQIGKFNRVITSDPEEYQSEIQKFCDELFIKYPKCTRALLDTGWLAPGEDFVYKICFSGIILVTIDLIKISQMMIVDIYSMGWTRHPTELRSEQVKSVRFSPVTVLIDPSLEFNDGR